MKIGIVTTHNANNYGAILQAYALQQVLSQYGEVKIINYENRHISISFDLIRLKTSIHGFLGMVKDLLRIFPRYRVINKFNSFIDKNLMLTKSVSSEDLLTGELNNYDVYISGSDQIWNPECITENGIIDPIYFLKFAPEKAKKISYASSVGGYQFSSSEKIYLKKLLKKFDTISVREKDTQVWLKNFLNRPVYHALDPTLLLSKQDWMGLLGIDSRPDYKEKYILIYTVPKNSLIRDAVDYFSKKMGLKVVALDQGLTASAKVDQHIRDAGPIEFIKFFANAQFVITDSFHGTCFSINFEKPFVVTSQGKHSNRIESLLSLVGLENRLVKKSDNFGRLDISIDFESAKQRLLKERNNSISILSDALKVS